MRLRHELIVARRYEKPEMYRGLYISPSHRVDFSRSLWHVVRTSKEATEWLGVELAPEWIIVTPPRSGVFLDFDAENRELFLLHAKLVLRVIPWTKGSEMDFVLGKRILVKPDDPRRVGVKIEMPEAYLKRPVTGTVVQVGPDVWAKIDDRIIEGTRIMYSLFAGTDVEIDGAKHVIMDADQAMMILDPKTRVEAA